MKNETINRLVEFWRRNFFIEPVLILVFIFCFIIALLYHYKEKERMFFIPYFFGGISLFTVASPFGILKIISGKKGIVLGEIANTMFELIEFVAFYFFFKKCLHSKTAKEILGLCLSVLSIVAAVFFVALASPTYAKEDILKHSWLINVIEFFFLFIGCLSYFYELFSAVPKVNLLERPSFLIVSSTFFYSALMIPFFIVASDMLRFERPVYDILFSFHFILLLIVLSTLARAFFNKIPITT